MLLGKILFGKHQFGKFDFLHTLNFPIWSINLILILPRNNLKFHETDSQFSVSKNKVLYITTKNVCEIMDPILQYQSSNIE